MTPRVLLLVPALLGLWAQVASADSATQLAKELVRQGQTGTFVDSKSGATLEINDGRNTTHNVTRTLPGKPTYQFGVSSAGRIESVYSRVELDNDLSVEHVKQLDRGSGVFEAWHETYTTKHKDHAAVRIRILHEETYIHGKLMPRSLVSARHIDLTRGGAVTTRVAMDGAITRTRTLGENAAGDDVVTQRSTKQRGSERAMLRALRSPSARARAALLRPVRR